MAPPPNELSATRAEKRSRTGAFRAGGRRVASGGFSLVELIVVLVIIGIMTGAIIAEMKGTFEEALLRSSAREIVRAIGLAHSQSVTGHRPHRLRLDSSAGRYHIEEWRAEAAEEGRFRAIPEIPRSEGDLDPRISFEMRKPEEETEPVDDAPPIAADGGGPVSSRETVLFSPDGTSEKVEILLRDRSGAGLALRVNPVTSRVRIVELEAERP